MLKLKLQYFGYLMGRTDSLEKTLMLGKIEGRLIWAGGGLGENPAPASQGKKQGSGLTREAALEAAERALESGVGTLFGWCSHRPS